jgi:Septation protein etd1
VPSGKVRRLALSVEDAAQQRRQDHERSASPAAEDTTALPQLRRRASSRNSWIKRFSFMSSRSESPSPSDGAHSPALAQSVDAKSFSQSSSTVPILGTRPMMTNPGPNKLVKRQSSQRLVGATSGSNAQNITLPRPATSHQRSAALHYHAFLNNQLLENTTPPTQTSIESPRWKQFFGVKMKKPNSQKQTRSHLYDNSDSIKRILPDNRYIPALISAKSILTSGFDVDDISVDDASLDFSSRPGSSKEYPFPRPISAALDSTLEEPQAPDIPTPEDSPRLGDSMQRVDGLGISRAFSFSSLLKRRPSQRQSSGKRPVKLVKRPSRRVVSEPVRSVGLQIDESDNETPPKRKQPSMSRKEGDAQQTVQHEQATAYLTAPGGTSTSSLGHVSGRSSPYVDSEAGSPNITHNNFYLTENRPIHSSTNLSNSQPQIVLPNQTRRSNASAAVSEQLSTLIGSDNEASRALAFADDEDTDRSTLFDSLRTRGTRSTSGAHKRRIETIFDESPSPPISASPKLREILPEGMLGTPSLGSREFRPTIEEEDIINTPVRTIRSDRADDGSPTTSRIKGRTPLSLQLSSPADMTKALSLGTLEYDDEPIEEDDESRWSCLDEDSKMDLHEDEGALGYNKPTADGQSNAGNTKFASPDSSVVGTPKFGPEDSLKDLRRDTRSSLFDWSEQPTEKASGDRSPPRPRTVHGKKDTTRGSRSVGRRAPSGLHARSQSVPVVPGPAGKRETVVTNKFGTWGVGSKGVSDEIWDDDFDFGDDDLARASQSINKKDEKRSDSGAAMHIPQTIREQQAKVVNNIGLVREFGLLVEELKANRIRAAGRGLLESPRSSLWREVDAMIELADQEVDDPIFPPRTTPPSSPPPDFDLLDDSADVPQNPWPRSTPNARRNRSRRRSVLPSESDIFSTPASQTSQVLTSSPLATPQTGRPRKDSEAMARSVIEALHRRKDTSDASLSLQPVPSHKKVPFDTNTLRYIVSHVQKLVRQVEYSLNNSEDQNDTSFALSSGEQQPLKDLFKEPSREADSKPRRLELNDGNDVDDSDDINARMKSMDLT